MSKPLPTGWKLEPLRRLAQVVSGGTPSRYVPEFWEGGSIPWVTPTDITGSNSRFLHETREHITELGLQSCSAKKLPPGTLLMTSRATLGEVRIALGEVCTNQGFKSLIPFKGIDGHFLYYQIGLNKERYKGFGIGSTFLEVNKRDTERFELLVAPEKEQPQIAEILSTVDEAIEQTEALIAKYQQIKAGLMHDLFTRGITPDGCLRPTREQAPHLYKECPLGWIPKEWEVVRIADVFDIQLGKMLNKLAKAGKLSAPYLGNRAVQWDFVDISAVEVMDFNAHEREKFALLPDDLLVCEGGDVGRTAMWRGEIDGCYYQKAIHRLRPKSDNALPAFMLRFMRFARDNGYFREFTSQSSIAHLTQEKLGSMSMLLPTKDEQRQIAERFDTLDDIFRAEQSRWAKLRQLKHGLMRDLLTGRARVKVDESKEARA